MRLTAAILLFGCLTASASGKAQTVSLNVTNAPLRTVLKEIIKQTRVTILYNEEILKDTRPVSITVNNIPLQQVLDQVFSNQPLSYTITGKNIIISPKEIKKYYEENNQLTAPPIDVSGRVVNENGEPVEGVTVSVKGTKLATSTDANGEFAIKTVSPDAILVFTSVNMEPFRMTVNGKAELIINLKTKVSALQDVVINKGYYVTRSRLNTGNVTKVSSDVLERQPVNNPIVALEGRVPGLYISQSSGVPGSNINLLQLRGQNSIANGNSPLFIVDGVPFPSTSLTSANIGGGAAFLSPFSSLNIADIESIEVLKDADATAIYGSRGGNGVIIITTKKGKSSKTKFDVGTSMGIGSVATKMKLLNTQQYLTMRREAFANDSKAPGAADYDINGAWDTTRYTDWQKVFIGNTARINDVQASVSGGKDNTYFNVSGGYRRETTVYPGDYNDKKGSLHVNIGHSSIDKRFSLSFSNSYVSNLSILPSSDLTSYILLAPNAPALYDNNGSLNWQNSTWTNPFADLYRKAKSSTDNLIGNLNLRYQIFPGLEVKGSFGYNKIEMNQSILFPMKSYSPAFSSQSTVRVNQFATNTVKTWIAEPQLSYRRDTKMGIFDATVGSTFQENTQNAITQIARDFPSDALIENPASAASISIFSSINTKYRYNAIYGRIGYNYGDRYLINLTGRRDGSSRFASGNQFGNFCAVGLGWIFSKEKFISDNLGFLTFGKFRASYGTTGNDQLPDYQYLSTYSSYNRPYQGGTGLTPQRIANPYFGWEEVKQLEVGLELGLIRDRVSLNLNYYKKRTGNQLVGYSLPNITGFSSIQANLPAIIENEGYEFEFNSINLKTKTFTWSTSLNLSIPKNKLLAYPNIQGSSYANTYTIGKSLFTRKLLHALGVDPQTGLYIFDDLNKDGSINTPNDLIGIKEVSRKYYGGFGNTFDYKGLQLSIFFQFVKQTGSNYMKSFVRPGSFTGISSNQMEFVLNRWKNPGDITSVQRFSQNNATATTAWSNARSLSDLTIEDASFIRLKNISISYKLPEKLIKVIHLQNTRVYFEGTNIFTITRYNGFDPETQGLFLPPLRILSAGVQLTF